MSLRIDRRSPLGAEPVASGVHFRVWSPRVQALQVVFDPTTSAPALDLSREGDSGYFSGLSTCVRPGMDYSLRLDHGSQLLPDPASRYQPQGPRGPSRIVDPLDYAWHDAGWPGISIANQVLYEMHVGTFTQEGTWTAATRELAELARLGVTTLELMPIGEFPGRFGWGYDVANQFAPTCLYGPPDEVRRFVDEAHRVGLGVILDVVYNHFGRVGEELLRPFFDGYFTERYENEWGSAINFDGADSGPVREFFIANARQWIADFHFDGLRVDATQAFHDKSESPVLLEITRAAREAAGSRRVLMIGESEPQDSTLLRPGDEGGCEFDALWNDDFHHSACVRLSGRGEAYYSDYQGSAEELLAAVQWGYLYQGQRYAWQDKPRGKPALDIAAPRFVNYLQNHDQVANSIRGARINDVASPALLRAMTALLLLAPQTPLLFQGQEFAASSPFLYFNDSQGDVARSVRQGRAKFLSQFRSLASPEAQAVLVDPCDDSAFRRCKLDLSERVAHRESYALHRDLLQLRRDDPVLGQQSALTRHACTIGGEALAIRLASEVEQCRLVLINFGRDLRLPSVSQPLIAPPAGCAWEVLWSSEDLHYGGNGRPRLDTPQGWYVPGEAAFVLAPISPSH